MKPIVGVPLDFVMDDDQSRGSRGIPGQLLVLTTEPSMESFREAGAIPVGLGRANSLEEALEVVERIDGLCVPGGPDLYPALYGKRVSRYSLDLCLEKDESDAFYVRAAVQLKKPILGLCRGMQLTNCVLGGDMIEDIPHFTTSKVVHSSPRVPASLGIHPVCVEADSFLAKAIGSTCFDINSYHHQAVNRLGDGLRCVAKSPEDGIVEAVENEDGSIVGVQWHPEYLRMRQPEQKNLFKWFVDKLSNN